MSRIERGMVVRVLPGHGEHANRLNGTISKTVSKAQRHNCETCGSHNAFDLEDDQSHWYCECVLEPVNPPPEDRFQTCDQDFKEELSGYLRRDVTKPVKARS